MRAFKLSYGLVFALVLTACGAVPQIRPAAAPPFVPLAATDTPEPQRPLPPVPSSLPTLPATDVYTPASLPTQMPTILPILLNPCISYYDAAQKALKFACRRFENYWRPIQVVDSDGDAGWFSSLAFDAQARAHLAYYAADSGDLRYARQNAGGWQVETVDSEGDVGYYPSLAIRYDGQIFISYYDRGRASVKVAQRSPEASWEIALIEKVGDLDTQPGQLYQSEFPEQFRTSIGVDGRGYPIVSYIGNLAKNLKVVWWDGAEWQIKLVDPSAPSGGFNSLAIAPDGSPAIGYHDIEQGSLRYAWWDGRKWLTETIDDRGKNIGLFTSLTFDSRGRPHISYFDDDPDTLYYATRQNNAWLIRSMSPGIFRPGFFSSIALGQDGRPLIAYYEFNEGDLIVAAWDGNAFNRTPVDAVGSVGWYPSIKFIPSYP